MISEIPNVIPEITNGISEVTNGISKVTNDISGKHVILQIWFRLAWPANGHISSRPGREGLTPRINWCFESGNSKNFATKKHFKWVTLFESKNIKQWGIFRAKIMSFVSQPLAALKSGPERRLGERGHLPQFIR